MSLESFWRPFSGVSGPERVVPCAVLTHYLGHRCGYVGVPVGHPLYGRETSNPAVIDLDVHGGVTYAGKSLPSVSTEEALWWLGFDCAHSGDAPDPALVTTEVSSESELSEMLSRFSMGGHVWSLEEVTQECNALALQLLRMFPSAPIVTSEFRELGRGLLIE